MKTLLKGKMCLKHKGSLQASRHPGWSTQTPLHNSKGLPPFLGKGLREDFQISSEQGHGVPGAWKLNHHLNDDFSLWDVKWFSRSSELGTVFGHIISSPPSQENLESTQALFTLDRGMINGKRRRWLTSRWGFWSSGPASSAMTSRSWYRKGHLQL